MKIRKKVIVYAGTAIYLFISSMLGFLLFQQIQEKETLANEISTNHAKLEELTPANIENDIQILKETAERIDSEIDGLKVMMSTDIDNVPATELVFDIAAKKSVDIVQLNSPRATHDVLENIPFNTVLISAVAEGESKNLVEFVTALNLALDTGVIQTVHMNLQDSENQTPSAMILMEVYNYQDE